MYYVIIVVCTIRCEYGVCVANDTCKCADGYSGTYCSEPGMSECTHTHNNIIMRWKIFSIQHLKVFLIQVLTQENLHVCIV